MYCVVQLEPHYYENDPTSVVCVYYGFTVESVAEDYAWCLRDYTGDNAVVAECKQVGDLKCSQ